MIKGKSTSEQCYTFQHNGRLDYNNKLGTIPLKERNKCL